MLHPGCGRGGGLLPPASWCLGQAVWCSIGGVAEIVLDRCGEVGALDLVSSVGRSGSQGEELAVEPLRLDASFGGHGHVQLENPG